MRGQGRKEVEARLGWRGLHCTEPAGERSATRVCTQSDGSPAVSSVFVANAYTLLHVKRSTMILDMFSDETAQGWGLTTKNQQANHNGAGLLHADQSSVDRQSLTTLGQGGYGQGIR